MSNEPDVQQRLAEIKARVDEAGKVLLVKDPAGWSGVYMDDGEWLVDQVERLLAERAKLVEALEGMQTSYEVLRDYQPGTVFSGVVAGAFLDTPRKAADLLKQLKGG